MNEAVSPALEGVSISASAARRLNAILKGEAGAALRISARGGGCSASNIPSMSTGPAPTTTWR